MSDTSKSDQPTIDTTPTGGGEPTPEKKGSIFGKLGFGGAKKSDQPSSSDTQATAGAPSTEPSEPLPPNHFGSDVPEGASKDLADPGTVAPGQTDGIASQGAPPQTPTAPPATAADPNPEGGVGQAADSSSPASPGSPGRANAHLVGSRGEGRGSIVPPDAPKSRSIQNENAIPTAGGMRLGSVAGDQRRASRVSQDIPQGMPKLDREGSPDPVTATNTQSNTAPTAGRNTAPQQMNDFSMSEASSKPAAGAGATEAQPTEGAVAAAAAQDVAPDQIAPGTAAPTAGQHMSFQEPEKGGATTNSGTSAADAAAGSSPDITGGVGQAKGESSGGHQRKGSLASRMKDKLHIGSSKNKS